MANKFQIQRQIEELRTFESGITENTALALGTFTPNDGDLSPKAGGGAAKEQFDRAVRQVTSLGPVIVSKHVNGTIGSVTWDGKPKGGTGEDTSGIDKLPLLDIAEKLLKQLLYGSGVAAAHAYVTETGEARISVLTGSVFPTYVAMDTDYPDALYVTGTYKGEDGKDKRMIRFYDLQPDSNGLVEFREWADAKDQMSVGGPPTSQGRSYPPRFAIYGMDSTNMPYSMFGQNKKHLFDLYGIELGKFKSREFAAYPIPIFEGSEVQQVDVRTPVGVPLGGDFRYADNTGTMSAINTEREISLEAVKLAFALPASPNASAGQTPSGDSQAETKEHAMQMWARLAGRLNSILPALVTDWLHIQNKAPKDGTLVNVTVMINTNATKGNEIDNTIRLFEGGLLSLEAAVNHIAQFYDAWSTDDIDKFVQSGGSQPQGKTPEEIQALLGG